MCSCSGNCNCNSTTIPRGPQGQTGAAGAAATIAVGNVTALPSGSTPTITNSGTSSVATFNFGIPAGAPGTNGDDGLNAFTTLTAPFLQPNINSTIVISVVNSSWVAIDQIIFIGPTTFINAGGYYRVIDIPTLTSIEIIRLDWTIPGITFRAFNTIVGATGTLVTTSGTIGATGATGANGSGITIIKSITNTIPGGFGVVNSLAGTPFTLTSTSDTFLANDLCPNDGDIGRITYEVVAYKTANSGPVNISMDIFFGMQGFSPPELNPYTDTITNQDNNKINQLTWNAAASAVEYIYIKYVVDVQRITSTTANIFIDWKAKSATTSNSGCYHNTSTITALDFEDFSKVFEFAVKGFNNSSTATVSFIKSRFYVESLRLPQP